MKTTITCLLLFVFNHSFSQENITDLTLRVSAGANEQPYFEKIWGHYLKAGVKYPVYKKFSLLLSHEMSESDNYPKDFIIRYNNYLWGEQAFVNKYIGISRTDWINGKTNFISNSNSLFILQGTYDFYLGKKKQLLFSPKFGYSFVKTKYFLTTIQEAVFINDKLTSGKVLYENKILKLWGFHYGLEFAKIFNDRNKVFFEINKTADKTGEEIYEFFEAFTVGVGYEIKLGKFKE